MSILNNTRVAVRVCQLFYLENKSQKQISDDLGISRPQISRILATARKENLVNIKINDPFARESVLQEQIRRRYPVREALVFDTSISADRLVEFGRMAAQCLEMFISDGNTVGMMSGRTVFATVSAVGALYCRRLRFVPLVGGLGPLNADWHANAIALQLAQKSGGVSYVLNAPIFVSDAKSRDVFINDPDIVSVLQSGAKCDVAFVGVGDICKDSTTIRAGGYHPQDIAQLQKSGAVASVCCSYLDAGGRVLDTCVSDRSIGVSLPDLAGSKVVALAIGRQKLQALHSVLSSGYIHAVMTDFETAQGLLALKEK